MIKMRAIEYNTWMSLMYMIETRFKAVANTYGIINTKVGVLPAYPRDLTNFTKPSIIIQKVNNDQSTLGFGGFIGQMYDESEGAYVDVTGIEHDWTFQIDVNGDSNASSGLITSMITEDIINEIRMSEGGKFPLKDFTVNVKAPTDMGYCKFIGDVGTSQLESNTNSDYITAIRFDIVVIQVIVPRQQFVDLGKWIKYKQTINL